VLVLFLTLALFSILGVLRGGDQFAAIASRSEFMAVFTTGLDLANRFETGDISSAVVANLLTADLQRLVPQPLLPFQKFDPAVWYVRTFYPFVDEQGGGYAFGMVAESVLTGGAPSAIFRGVALGAALGLVNNWLVRRPGLFRAVVYMWLMAFIYLAYRDTTFTLAGRFLYQLAPSLIMVWALRWVLVRASQIIRPDKRVAPESPVDTAPALG
jgi:hypothetical protein